MIYLPVLLLMLVAVGIVIYPLLVQRSELFEERNGASGSLDELLSERDAAYAGIRELEFEHELGNLSQEDYQELRSEYRRKAAGVLQQIERAAHDAPVANATSPEAEIESAVQRLRQRRGQAALSPACPLCHESVTPGDNHCANCGAALGRFCSGCGEAREPGDRFCRFCGRNQEAVS